MPAPLLPLALAALFAWGIFGDWFGSAEVEAPDQQEVAAWAAAQAVRVGQHPATAQAYEGRGALWQAPAARLAVARLLADADADGVAPADIRADAAGQLWRSLDAAERQWESLDGAARDTLADPRPARLASLDVALTDALLRYGDALRGRRADPSALYPNVWFPTARDSTGARFGALVAAARTGDAEAVAAALDGLRPPHAGYARLRARLAALADDLPPVPAGADLAAGQRSVRVPHLRERLEALGFAPTDTLGAWTRPDAYRFTDALAAALGRFEAARGLPEDGVLDAAATDAVNADLAPIRRTLALNLERWRWLPDDLGDHFVWVNLPAFELRVLERAEGSAPAAPFEERLRMPVNIGNAMTTGWTTPVLTDSIHAVEFQPAWYVPRSLAASNVFPMAVRDSLALWRSGFEVYRNGAAVDSRLVPWDSVSVSEFRFVQRPGPGNPLGRVKFLMHNPYAILIHDTNKRHTFNDGSGSTMSSGCVQAGAPDVLAEYLMTTVNGWDEGQATRAWRGGPRRGVGLERPFRTHFVYFTAVAEPDGGLVLTADPYGYDARLANALGLADLDDAPDAADA